MIDNVSVLHEKCILTYSFRKHNMYAKYHLATKLVLLQAFLMHIIKKRTCPWFNLAYFVRKEVSIRHVICSISCFFKGVLHPWALFLKTLYIFSKNKCPMDLVRNVPRNSKITVLLQQRPSLWSYSKKCVKINIFHVLSHKSIITYVSEITVQ